MERTNIKFYFSAAHPSCLPYFVVVSTRDNTMMNGAHHHRTFVKQNKIIKTTSFTTSFSSCSSSSSFVLLRGAKSSSNTKKKKTTKKDVLSTFTCRIHDRGGERVSRRLSSSSCHSCSFSAASSSKDDDDSVDYEPPPLPPRNKGGVVTRKSKGEEDEEEDNNEENNIGPRLIQSIATATIGAFLFGYHSAVINAPLASIASDLGFAESDGLKGVVVSVMVLGGVLGGFSIAPFADKYGRKNALAFVTIPLAVGALISAVSWDAASMTFGRLITGIGVGASSQIVPLYLAEISPPSFRGTANGLRRMAYVFGCLAAFQLAVPLEEAANGGDGWWRPLFSDSVFPAVALAVTALVVAVESPVWLLATSEEIECEVEKKEIERESRRSLGALMNIRGKAAKVWQENIQKKEESSSSNSSSSSTSSSIAANSNNSSSNSESAAEENTTVEDDDRKETSSSISWSSTVGNSTSAVTSGGGGKKLETWSEIFKDETNVPSLITGVGLCALAAFSGSNTVIFYAKSVFSSVGLSSPELLTWAVGVPNIVGGVLALVFTDKLGRRPLLLWSFGGMSACLVALSAVDIYTHGVPFLSENNGGFGGGASSMTTSSKFFKASFCNTLDPSAVEVLSPEQKAKQRGSLSINEGYFSDIFNVQQSSYSSFTTKSIICEDLPDREIGGLIEDVAIQGRDTKSNNSGERQEPEATIALISLPLYVLFFSAGAGPVPWLLYNEVFPTRIRAKAVSLCTATNYFSNAIVGSAFLPGVTFLGLGGTYAGYALLNLLGYVFVKELVFETKGMKLEDIEETMLEKWAKNKNATS
ncbi:unnamed protein product [Bathycoccus prasinos]